MDASKPILRICSQITQSRGLFQTKDKTSVDKMVPIQPV